MYEVNYEDKALNNFHESTISFNTKQSNKHQVHASSLS